MLAEAESTHARSFEMIWDTPQAIDFRFGMRQVGALNIAEITRENVSRA